MSISIPRGFCKAESHSSENDKADHVECVQLCELYDIPSDASSYIPTVTWLNRHDLNERSSVLYSIQWRCITVKGKCCIFSYWLSTIVILLHHNEEQKKIQNKNRKLFIIAVSITWGPLRLLQPTHLLTSSYISKWVRPKIGAQKSIFLKLNQNVH